MYCNLNASDPIGTPNERVPLDLSMIVKLMGLLLASRRLWSVVCGTIVVEAAILSMSISRTELDDPAESSKLRASVGLFIYLYI